MQSYDLAVVGGGIVGTATAMDLSSTGKTSVVVLEAEGELAAHQTGHNSGVIHSGLYYKPGSQKARNCVAGREALYRFCAQHGIAHDRCGKLVVATRESHLPALAELERRGQANGLSGIRRLDGSEQIKELEPHVEGIAGLHVPETGIVDFVAVTKKYGEEIERQGGEIRTGSALRGVQRESGGMVLETTSGELRCRYLINCAGLQCDRVARLCGVDPGLRIVPFRGEYYVLKPERESLVRNLVYPVPDPRFPFLGVHFTRMVQGGIEAGPNAVLALRREGYRRFSISLRDVFSWFFYRGFWRMARKYWRTGFGEVWRSFSKRAFVKGMQQLVPEIRTRDVRRGGVGIRAQALTPDGMLADDFRIVEAEGMIHVLNAPSPAATASMAIGQDLARLARKNFNLT